jgi:hypothetical protein
MGSIVLHKEVDFEMADIHMEKETARISGLDVEVYRFYTMDGTYVGTYYPF